MMKKYLKKKNHLTYQKLLVYLKIHNFFKITTEENISKKFRLKNVDETKQYFIEEIKQNELNRKKLKKRL